MIDRIRLTNYFAPIFGELDLLMDPKTFTGRASQQVVSFVEKEVDPLLQEYQDILSASKKVDIDV